MTATAQTLHAEFDVIAALSQDAIRASIAELAHRDRLTIALRTALQNGMDINDLSAVSGLTPSEIRLRVGRELNVLSDLEMIAGMR